MANNDGFVEWVSEGALKELREGTAEIKTQIQLAGTLKQKFSEIKTPSASDSAVKQLTDQLKAQEKAIVSLQAKYDSLAQKQQAKVQKSREEIITTRIQNQQTDVAIKSNLALAGAYANLSAKESMAARNLQNLIAAGRQAGQTQRQYNAELRIAQKDFDGYRKKLMQADDATGRWGRSNVRAVSTIRDLMGAFGIVGGVTLFAAVTRDIYQNTKELQSLDNALKQVTDTQENFAEQQAFLNDISQRYGAEIKSLTKQYTQFYVSAKDKLAGKEIQGIFESVTKAGAVMGLSIESQERAFLALNQMMSKGTIQAEELRGQLGEALPGAFGIMAKAVGTTEKGLMAMMKSGDLLAKDVLPKFAKQLEKTYGIENINNVNTLAAAQNRLSNSWLSFVRSLNESDTGGISAFFRVITEGLSGMIDMLVRANTSWDELYKKARGEGKASGADIFKKQMEALSGTGDDKEVTETIIRTQRNRFVVLKKSLDEVDNLLEGYAKKSTFAKVFTQIGDVEENSLKARKEAIELELGKVQGVWDAATAHISGADKKTTKVIKELTDEQKKALEDRAQMLYAIRKKELELEQQVIDRTLEKQEATYGEMLAALEYHRLKRIEILTLQYNEEKRRAGNNLLLQKDALLNYHADTLKEIDDFQKRKAEIEAMNINPENLKAGLVNSEMPELTGDAGVKAFEEQQEAAERFRLEMLALKQATEDYIKTVADSTLGDLGMGSLQQFFDGTFDRLMAGADTLAEKFAVTFKAITDVAMEAFSFIEEMQNAQFNQQYDRLEREKDVALQFAGESAGAREEIERQYEERRKAIQRRQAEAEKKNALFQIIIKTAQGVVAALASLNIPLSIAIGVIGAAQAALVASQPIPEFAEGGTHTKGGLMKVNDAKGSNYRETIVTPDGKVMQPLGRDVIMNAPKGTKIYTPKQWDALQFNNDLNGILMNNSIGNAPVVINQGISREDITAGVAQAFSGMPKGDSLNITVQDGKVAGTRTSGSVTTEIMNARFNVKGLTIGRP